MRAPKIRAPHLGDPRPVPVTRAVTGPIRLVMVADRRDYAAIAAATLTGLGTLALLIAGITTIL